jgi:hypothetical protein
MSAPVINPIVAPADEWMVDLAADHPEDIGQPRPVGGRKWFRWSLASLPVAPLLLLGMLLGPQGLFVLTPGALETVDPALPVALAMLGALLGLMPGLQGPVRRAVTGSALTAGVTVLLVSAGFAAGSFFAGEPFGADLWLLPLVLAIAAASSLIVPVHRSVDPFSGPAVTIESEALVSVVAGGLLLAFVRQGTVAGTIIWLLQACAVVAVLGLAGYLLLRRSVVDAERRVFAVATLLLVGGAADSLSFSALLGGVCAGFLWKACGGAPRDSLQRDMLYALPPLLALVLVVAGARVEFTTISVGLAAGYAAVRSFGRVASATLSSRFNPRAEGGGRLSMLAPGMFGVAFALTAFRALGAEMSLAISIVAIGTVLSEVTALLVTSRGGTE